jgi:hypothetical protein
MPQPCTPWVTGDDVADCCEVETSSGVLFDAAAEQASALLFELSGRLFPGECGPKTVRPPCHGCACGYQVLSRGYVVGPWNWNGGVYSSLCDYCLVSCSPSRIKLSGYPVREIDEIKIDGDVVDPSLYTLWKRRYVTRLDDGHWPYQQNLTLADTEDGTFSISYTYGADPPEIGIAAAAQLGCEIYNACANGGAGAIDCALPAGVTRVTRQGITIEKQAFVSWGYIGKNQRGFAPGWKTGLSLVDAFLNAYNQAGIMRRPVFWGPGHRQYSQEFG